jgi:hypothetical protein
VKVLEWLFWRRRLSWIDGNIDTVLPFNPRLGMSSYKAGVASDLDETSPSDLVKANHTRLETF